MLADYHLHTYYSPDSSYPMENLVRDAIRIGLDEICFTDHCEYIGKFDESDQEKLMRAGEEPFVHISIKKYIEEIKKMQLEYGDKIRIRTGVEFGLQTHTIPLIEYIFRKYAFDFVILSIHQVNDEELWLDYQYGKTQEEYNRLYYEELLNVARRYRDYSVLGHLDLIARYDQQGIFPFQKIRPYVEEILRIVIEDQKGIELNTSSYRYHLPDTTPSTDILKLYRSMGGTIITIGTDAHKSSHMGGFIKESQEFLSSLGFEGFYTYDKMVPIFHQF